ncbi:MAG: hypothetical protein P3W90_000770 [Paracoccus sp. (in: a-proteobacteria)]|nr:hypothetical protein [Paracoccus sp. (in: a-proteobacteria)]
MAAVEMSRPAAEAVKAAAKAVKPEPDGTKPAKTPLTPVKPGKAAKPVTAAPHPALPFNILIVAQAGVLACEALLFTASLRRFSPDWAGRLVVAIPEPEGAWAGHRTAPEPAIAATLRDMGAELTPFTAHHFGAAYPQGNKIEALSVLPAGEPFVFFDTDTLITGPLDRIAFDFSRPSASMRRQGTWPDPPLYGPGFTGIWKSLYDRFGLEFESSLDLSQPDEYWQRYLYFNAGWFFGADPAAFGARFLDWARAVRDDPGEALACQSLDPWLDQIVLPLVIHSFGGGRPGAELKGLDGAVSCHYRHPGLLYAREDETVLDALETVAAANRITKHLRGWELARQLISRGRGRAEARPLGAGAPPERVLRKRLREAGLWAL